MRVAMTAELIATYIITVINTTQGSESDLYVDINEQYVDYPELNYYTVNGVTWITVKIEANLLTFCVDCWNKLAGTKNGTEFMNIVLTTEDRVTELSSYIERMM